MRPFPLPVTQPVEEMVQLGIKHQITTLRTLCLVWPLLCSCHLSDSQFLQQKQRHIMNFNEMNTPKRPVGWKLSVGGINITVIHTLKVDDNVSSFGELVGEVSIGQTVLCGFVLILHHLGVVGQLHKLPEDVGLHTHTPLYSSVFQYLKGDSLTAAVIHPTPFLGIAYGTALTRSTAEGM